MSDEELDRQAAMLMASVVEASEDAEPALELTDEAAADGYAGPTDAALEELKTEVLSAVRGAITDVMSRHQPALPEPDLDLDFSLREPPEAPRPDFEPESSMQAPLAPDLEAGLSLRTPAELQTTDLEAGWGPELLLAELPAAPLEPADPEQFVLPIPSNPAMVPVLAPLAVLPVPVKLPDAAARRRVPGWTAAALLSMSGLAVGAGAAILLVDPNATAQFRESFHEKFSSALAVLGEQTEAASEASLNDGPPGEVLAAEPATTGSEVASTAPEAASPPSEVASTGTEVTLPEATSTEAEAPASGTEFANLTLDGLPSVLDPAAPLPYSIEPPPVEVRAPIGAKYTGAPVIALAPIALVPIPVEAPAVSNPIALSRAVRVATASDTAAFARAFELPVDVSIAFNAARHVTSLDTLAALPAPVAVMAAEESGTATGSIAVKLPAVVEPAQAGQAAVAEPVQAEPTIATKPAQPEAEPVQAEVVVAADSAQLEAEPPTGAESSEPATILSAMARANEALRNGDVDKARMLLQSESEAGQAEAMLVLARSFDPSYLMELGIASSKGNAETAEKLYRAWYDQSVKLGLVSEGININRLIRAMARAKP